MRKLILSFLIIMAGFVNVSCITPAEIEYSTVMYSDIYVYEGVTYPVYYIDHIAYYWILDQWVVVPLHNYHLIRHFDHPRYFAGYYPRYHRDIHRRPHTRHPDVRPRHDRRNDIHRPNPRSQNERLNRPVQGQRPQSRIEQRPSQRPSQSMQSRPNTSRPSSNRSGNFGGRR